MKHFGRKSKTRIESYHYYHHHHQDRNSIPLCNMLNMFQILKKENIFRTPLKNHYKSVSLKEIKRVSTESKERQTGEMGGCKWKRHVNKQIRTEQSNIFPLLLNIGSGEIRIGFFLSPFKAHPSLFNCCKEVRTLPTSNILFKILKDEA